MDLAETLGVSVETVRRDIAYLERHGVLRRLHGGASAISSEDALPIEARIGSDREAKARIAALARPMVQANDSVFIGAGSTTLALAWELRNGPKAAFTSNMVEVILSLSGGGQEDLTLLGGRYFASARAFGGFENLELIARRSFDIAFLSVHAIHSQRGLLGPTESHAALVKAVRDSSKKLVILSTVKKLERTDFLTVLKFSEVDAIVFDRAPPEPFYKVLEGQRARIFF